MASHNQPIDYAKRHQSRIKREMYANRINPFNSPPSSTGTHGTVSDTTGDLSQNLSNFSFHPDDEGTRKLSDDIDNNNHNSQPKRFAGTTGRFGTRPTTTSHLNNLPNINTSALARSFPEWGTDTNTGGIDNTSTNLPTRPAAKPAVKFAPKAAPVTFDDDTKENIPPPAEDTLPVITGKYLHRRTRTRAEMQPRVETPSESSTVLSRTPTQPIQPSRRSRFAKAAQQPPSSPVESPRTSIQNHISKTRIPQPSKEQEFEMPRASMDARQQKFPSSSPINQSALTNGRSFLIPSFHHLLDLTSGTLKFSTLKNGVPVFVKHGKARTQFEQPANQHDTVEAVDVPEEDQEIFVSMDKIREEVQELQEHDQMIQREAEKLQLEVNRLQSELKRFKQRKPSDSAFGSGSESEYSINRALDAQRNLYDEKIAQLQSRLEQAGRQVGVNDIHSAALTAERDEALHQASQAREKAKKLQAELESAQKDRDNSDMYRRDKNEIENNLRAANDSLREANENLRERNVVLSTEKSIVTAELNSVKSQLSSLNEEIQDLRKVYESLLEEKHLLAEDHAGMERQNESFFKENKNLRSKIDLDERRISDLEKSISRRDQLITELQDNMTQMTGHAGDREEYAGLLSKVKKLTDQDANEHRRKDDVIRSKDSVIKSQADQLSRLQEQLADGMAQQREVMEYQREVISLKDEILRLRQDEATWKRQRIKNARMSHHEYDLQKDLENRRGQQEQWEQEKQKMQQEVDELRNVLQSIRHATKQVADLNHTDYTNITERTGKVTQSRQYAVSEQSGHTEALNVDEDPTRQVNMTGQSDFLSVLTGQPVVELKEVTDHSQHRKQNADEALADNTVQTIDSDLPSLPGPLHRRSRSDETLNLKQKQPAGILKKSSKYAQDDNTTGALSVRSAHSAVSVRSQISSRSYRSGSDNMTSAFIIPDITLENRKCSGSQDRRPGSAAGTHKRTPSMSHEEFRRTMDESRAFQQRASEEVKVATKELKETFRQVRERSSSRSTSRERGAPSLSKEAVSVLDNICHHKTANCTVCSRMTPRVVGRAQAPKKDLTWELPMKLHVSVPRPIPVSDRKPQVTEDYTEDNTMRPSMPPGKALAVVIKELEDEAKHLELQMEKKMQELFSMDKATSQRKRKLASIQHQEIQRELETKSAQIYKLHDVLEGQKSAGQLMTQEEVDVTVASICGFEPTKTRTQTATKTQENDRPLQSKDEWNGFDSATFD